MGFFDFLPFDFLLPGSRQLDVHRKRVSDRNATAEDRDAAIRWLANKGTEDALYALFSRFDLQLEHTLKDRSEKELTADLLLEKGAVVVPLARRFAASSPQFQHAVRIVDTLAGAAAATDLLLELLGNEDVANEFKPGKKHNLLIALAERKDARILPAAARFLTDHDEGVRAAAVEAIAAQAGAQPADTATPDTDARTALLGALCNRREESTRIRGRLADVFIKNGWSVADADPWLATHVPDGYRIEGDRLQAAPGRVRLF